MRLYVQAIPLDWAGVANRLPEDTFGTVVALWFLLGLKKNNAVKLRPSVLVDLGISDRAVRRALVALERAGLVRLDRRKGKRPIVTILGALSNGKLDPAWCPPGTEEETTDAK